MNIMGISYMFFCDNISQKIQVLRAGQKKITDILGDPYRKHISVRSDFKTFIFVINVLTNNFAMRSQFPLARVGA